MLVLTRRYKETLVLLIPDREPVFICVEDIRAGRIKVSVDADSDIRILKGEDYDRHYERYSDVKDSRDSGESKTSGSKRDATKGT